MRTQKVSVTLESTTIERARRAAGSRGLSSYLDAALEEKLERDERRQAFLEYLVELERQDPTPDLTKRRRSKGLEDPRRRGRVSDPLIVLDSDVIDLADGG